MKWTRATLMIMALAAPSAWAEPAKSGADPAAQTLPEKASDTATANAFGLQGARMRAAHQAARAAAAQQAQAAATRGQPTDLARPSASATSHASATGVTNGFERATAGAANGQAAAHRR